MLAHHGVRHIINEYERESHDGTTRQIRLAKGSIEATIHRPMPLHHDILGITDKCGMIKAPASVRVSVSIVDDIAHRYSANVPLTS